MKAFRLRCLSPLLLLSVGLGLAGCAGYMPYSGPRASQVNAVASNRSLHGIQLVDVNYGLAKNIQEKLRVPKLQLLQDFRNPDPRLYTVGPGDTLQIYLWEAPPAMLFAAASGSSSTSTASGAMMTTIPEQMVGSDGDIRMPFAGEILCAGKTLNQIADEIQQRLASMAHDPQVVVRLVSNHAQSISVVGNVKKSTQVPLIPGGVTVLQALAAAGGVDQAVSKVSIQISHAGKVIQLPLQDVVQNPEENISLRAGDVVTALYKPLRVTIMGATHKPQELDFEASGISLAQALARSGGLDGTAADAKAVFVFRMENPDLLTNWPQPLHPLPNGKVPVVFRFDFSNPATLFAAQNFPIQNHDLVYVASAPITDLQKFLGLIVQIVYPIQGLTTAGVVR
jgi:polysaccharide export outer membrane protein